MMKILLVIGGVFLALALAAYLVLAHYLDAIVVKGVNTYGPGLTRTKVELASASLSPLSGSGTLTGLTVGNPAGWSDGRAFYLGKVQLDLEPRSVFGERIVINELIVDQPEFTYETRIVSSNIKDLLKNIEQYTGKGDAPATKSGRPVKFIVKKFRLTNGKATVAAGGKAVVITLPPISLDDLGVAEGGITAEQLATVLMNRVLGSIISGTTSALGQIGSTSGTMTVEQVKDAAKKAGDAFKKMFKEGK